MQWEEADFAPVQAPGELDETYASSLTQPIASIIWEYDVTHKTGST